MNLQAQTGHYPLKLILKLSSPFRSLPISFDEYIPCIVLVEIGESVWIGLFRYIQLYFEAELVIQLVTPNRVV
jgi:hypothetical protein